MSKNRSGVFEPKGTLEPQAFAETTLPEMLRDFIAAIENHPDAKLLGYDPNMIPPEHMADRTHSRKEQRIISIRILATQWK